MSTIDDILYSSIKEHREPIRRVEKQIRRVIIGRIELELSWLHPENYIHNAAVAAGFDPIRTWLRWDDPATGNVILEQHVWE